MNWKNLPVVNRSLNWDQDMETQQRFGELSFEPQGARIKNKLATIMVPERSQASDSLIAIAIEGMRQGTPTKIEITWNKYHRYNILETLFYLFDGCYIGIQKHHLNMNSLFSNGRFGGPNGGIERFTSLVVSATHHWRPFSLKNASTTWNTYLKAQTKNIGLDLPLHSCSNQIAWDPYLF